MATHPRVSEPVAASNASRKKHRDYTFLGTTQSLCPQCLEVVPAKIISRNGRIYFQKKCEVHGSREDFICSDAARYDRLETSLPAKLPQQTFTEPKQGCPKDCGLCSEHEQHTCIGVLEITDNCNLTCPMCYAGSQPGLKHKSLAQIKLMVDHLVRAEGRAEVLQFSGGEPTLHPHLLEAIRYAFDRPVDYIMINTNGIRFANDPELVDQLAEYQDRLEIYLQFDALDDAAVTQLRGREGLVETKLKALERLAQSGLNVTLVSTLQAGVNDSAPGDLVAFAASHPEVTGLSFQPATYSGRHELPETLESRITFPDVVDAIAGDVRNSFGAEDFFPLPCAHPNCHWLSLAARSSGGFQPFARLIDPLQNLDLLANGISFTRQQASSLAQQVVARLACGESGCCGPSEPSDTTSPEVVSLGAKPADGVVMDLLQKAMSQNVGARDILRITITSFLDAYNFDVRRVMKCCTHHVLPSGHIVPFCAYNVLYRDGTLPLPELSVDAPANVVG